MTAENPTLCVCLILPTERTPPILGDISKEKASFYKKITKKQYFNTSYGWLKTLKADL